MDGKTFEEALGELLAEYIKTPREDVMSALELALMAMREDEDDPDAR